MGINRSRIQRLTNTRMGPSGTSPQPSQQQTSVQAQGVGAVSPRGYRFGAAPTTPCPSGQSWQMRGWPPQWVCDFRWYEGVGEGDIPQSAGVNRSRIQRLTNTRMRPSPRLNVAQRSRERAIRTRAATMAAKNAALKHRKPARRTPKPSHPPIPGLDIPPNASVQTGIFTINGVHCVGLEIDGEVCGCCYVDGEWGCDC